MFKIATTNIELTKKQSEQVLSDYKTLETEIKSNITKNKNNLSNSDLYKKFYIIFGGYNKSRELFDFNYKSLAATLIFRKNKIVLSKYVDYYDENEHFDSLKIIRTGERYV